MKKPGLYTQPCGGDAAPGEALLRDLGNRCAALGCCARSASRASRSSNISTVEDTIRNARGLRLTAAMRGRRARWEGVLERLQSCGATRILCHPKCAALLYKLQQIKHRSGAEAAKKSASAPAEEEEDDDTEPSPPPSPARATPKRARAAQVSSAKRPRAPAPLECPICLENLDDASPALACDHRFHAACVQELVAKAWAEGAKRTRSRGTAVLCPLCRGQSYIK